MVDNFGVTDLCKGCNNRRDCGDKYLEVSECFKYESEVKYVQPIIKGGLIDVVESLNIDYELVVNDEVSVLSIKNKDDEGITRFMFAKDDQILSIESKAIDDEE